MNLLDDSVVLITGGGAGFGRALALNAAREGADIIVVDLGADDCASAESLRSDIEELGRRLLWKRADVRDQEALGSAVQDGISEFGGITSLIANAGVDRGGRTPMWETDIDDWNTIVDINLSGVWRTIRAIAPHMIERGSGSIVVVGSVDAVAPVVGASSYGISKAAVHGLTVYAAAELGSFGVRVNAIAPGVMDTEMVNSQSFFDRIAGGAGVGTRQHLVDYATSKVLLKDASLLPPDQVAQVAMFLSSNMAAAVTGTIIPVDAGYLQLPRRRLAK